MSCYKLYDVIWNGALGGDRTHNPCLRRAVLYPLSYERREKRILTEPENSGSGNNAGSILPHLNGSVRNLVKLVS